MLRPKLHNPRWLTSEYGVCGAGNPARSRLFSRLSRLKAKCPRGAGPYWRGTWPALFSQIGIFFASRQSIVINNFRGSSSEGGCGQDWPPHGETEPPVFFKELTVCTAHCGCRTHCCGPASQDALPAVESRSQRTPSFIHASAPQRRYAAARPRDRAGTGEDSAGRQPRNVLEH